MAEIECGKGHLYDSDLYAVCPYCNKSQRQGSKEKTINDVGRTAPLKDSQQKSIREHNVTRPVISPESGRSLATDVGKTRPLTSQERQLVNDTNKTVGYMEEKLGMNPVVGWLVCIYGKSKGKDYKLYGHINTIGRSNKMDVCLEDDKTISEENHARISYSDKNNRFYITPADGKNLFYVNGREILSPTQLNAYDIIDFGETVLIFVPLCCERFIWNNDI